MKLTRWKSPSQQREETLDFRYGLLQSSKNGIRLAQILPGSGNKGVAIKLIDSYVTGRDKVPYDALSYTWGDGARTKYLTCNGRRLTVTATLLEALQRFRDKDKVVTLWIDQICICQDRVKERNQQVSMMGDIFKSARKVVVWLGEHYDDSKAGMQLADQLRHIAQYQNINELEPGDLDAHGLPGRGHKKWKPLAAVLRRPWFWRTWVVQEVVLNPHVELVLGANMLTWDELKSVVALLKGPMPKIRPRAPRPAPHVPGPRRHRPRDKVYALLGLGKHDIIPDYHTSPEDVFIEFTQHQIGAVTNLRASREAAGLELSVSEREVRRAMVMLSCAGRQHQQRNLPSWVPDWTVNLASRPLIFGLSGERYSAGGSKLGNFDHEFDVGLQLSGILLDSVQAVGTELLDFDVPGDPHALIAAWWQEAQQIALNRIARSPASMLNTDAFDTIKRRLKVCKHGYYVGEERSQKRRGSLLKDGGVLTDASQNATQTLTLGPTRGRVMFASSTDFLGLVPHGTLLGDGVFVIRGADVPYVLRHRVDDAYDLIAEAYVQGIMDGEALEMGHLLPEDLVMR